MEAKRTNIVALVVGGRGTGKTTFLKGDTSLNMPGVVGTYLAKNPRQKILIVDTFLSETWDGIPEIHANQLKRWVAGMRRIVLSEVDKIETVTTILNTCFNTVIIFEDALRYIEPNIKKEFLRIPLDSKQKNIDVYFVFHALMQVPPNLVRLCDFIVLFKTQEEFREHYRLKYPFPQLHKAFECVNRHRSKYYYESVRIS